MKSRFLFGLLVLPLFLVTAQDRDNFVLLSREAPYSAPAGTELQLTGNGMNGDDLMLRFRLNQFHKIAGYTTLALGLLTGLTAPDDDEGEGDDDAGLHGTLGIATAGMSALTMGLGYAAHRGEVRRGQMSLGDGLHAALGITGGAMMIAAPFFAPSDAHKILGEAGWAAMGIAVGWELIY